MGVIRVTVLREPQEPSRDEGTVERRGNRERRGTGEGRKFNN